ncbi:MAG: hypothetical protein U1F33_03590 [Alphaproteobacteria bacterium]
MISRLEDRWLRRSLGVVSVAEISTDHDLTAAQQDWWRRQVAAVVKAACLDPADPEGRSYRSEVDGFDLRVTVRIDGTRVARRHKVMRGGDLAIEIVILTAHDEILPVLRHVPAGEAKIVE